MNDITVLDVLGLPIMSNARLRAGREGINNTIQYVNILDNRYDDTDTSAQLPKYGENFYITSMYYGKNDPAYILSVLKHFVEVNAAAVCIIDEYMSELSDEAYRLADESRLPIIFVDKETPYPIIISSIMERKLSYQRATRDESLLLALTSADCAEEQKLELLRQLNPNFADNLIVFHCLSNEAPVNQVTAISNQLELISKFNEGALSFASEFRGGILVIQSFKNSSTDSIQKLSKSTIEAVRRLLPRAVIGISGTLSILEADKGIFQAYTASKSGAHNANGITYFQNLGVLRLIMDMQGRRELENYFSEIYQPIQKYDNKYHSHLLDTAVAFIENNMDYIRTSKAMFVHENTVRYRLSKVRNLIPYGANDMDFQQTLYIFYKIMKLREFN